MRRGFGFCLMGRSVRAARQRACTRTARLRSATSRLESLGHVSERARWCDPMMWEVATMTEQHRAPGRLAERLRRPAPCADSGSGRRWPSALDVRTCCRAVACRSSWSPPCAPHVEAVVPAVAAREDHRPVLPRLLTCHDFVHLGLPLGRGGVLSYCLRYRSRLTARLAQSLVLFDWVRLAGRRADPSL